MKVATSPRTCESTVAGFVPSEKTLTALCVSLIQVTLILQGTTKFAKHKALLLGLPFSSISVPSLTPSIQQDQGLLPSELSCSILAFPPTFIISGNALAIVGVVFPVLAFPKS